MAKTFINLSLFVMFAFCTLPAFASETPAPVDQKTEQTTQQPTETPETQTTLDIQDEQQCSDRVAINNDLKKVVIVAGFVALTWALIYTYKKLLDANTHIAELEGIRLANLLINSK